MKLENATKSMEASYGTFSYSKREKDEDFTTYTARINAKFWEDVKGICVKNQLKLGDFIKNAFILYYLQLNGELDESISKKYINPEISDAASKLEGVTSVVESVENNLSSKIDLLQTDVKGLNSKLELLVTLFGGKLAVTAAQ